jgi:hypothetical protein
MAAVTTTVAMQPPSHEYHLMLSFASTRLFFLDQVETETAVSVTSLMVVSSDNPRPPNICISGMLGPGRGERNAPYSPFFHPARQQRGLTARGSDATVTALAQAMPYRWERNPAGQISGQAPDDGR